MKPASRSTPPLPLVLLALAASGAIVAGVLLLGPNDPATSGTTIRLASVGRGVVQQTVTASGNVEPLNEAGLNFKASGILTKLYVAAGQKVKAGQLLAEIDPTTAQVALEQAQANLKSAQANLAQVEATGSSASASARSTATSAATDAVELTAATGVTGATGPVVPATGATGATAPSGTATTPHVAPSAKKRTKPPASANHAAATTTTPQSPTSGTSRTNGASGSTGAAATTPGSNAGASTNTLSPAAIAANLATAQAAVATDQLTVKSDQAALAGTKLYATMSGTIASISGAVGSAVTAGSGGSSGTGNGNGGSGNSASSAIASALGSSSSSSSSSDSSDTSGFIVIAQMNPLKMDVSVAEANIGQIHVGQSADVSIDAITNLELAAKVTAISVLPTSSSGVVSYGVTLELTQSDPRVRPGMSASATIVVAQASSAVTVQSAAITSRGSTSTVTVDDNGKAVVTSVIPGLVGTNATQIVAGLKPGETVEIPITTRLSTAASAATSRGLGAASGLAGAGGLGGGGGGGGGGFRRLVGGGG